MAHPQFTLPLQQEDPPDNILPANIITRLTNINENIQGRIEGVNEFHRRLLHNIRRIQQHVNTIIGQINNFHPPLVDGGPNLPNPNYQQLQQQLQQCLESKNELLAGLEAIWNAAEGINTSAGNISNDTVNNIKYVSQEIKNIFQAHDPGAELDFVDYNPLGEALAGGSSKKKRNKKNYRKKHSKKHSKNRHRK